MADVRSPAVRLYTQRGPAVEALGFDPPTSRFVVQVESSGDFFSCAAILANGRLSTLAPPSSGIVRVENAVLLDAVSLAAQLRLDV